MKDLLKNKFTLDGNKSSDYREYLKDGEKIVSGSQKIRFQ